MKRQFRLRSREDFTRLRAQGRVFRKNGLLLSILENPLGYNRYGFVIGKAIGNAPRRNRIRRQLRVIMQMLHPHFACGYDLVWVARGGITEQPFPSLFRSVCQLTRQAGLYQQQEEQENHPCAGLPSK